MIIMYDGTIYNLSCPYYHFILEIIILEFIQLSHRSSSGIRRESLVKSYYAFYYFFNKEQFGKLTPHFIFILHIVE